MRFHWKRVAGTGLALLAVCGPARPARAQATLAPGDSITQRIDGHAGHSVFLALRDGDYADIRITHPSGLSLTVLRPDGTWLRPVIIPTLQGVHPITFVAEGGGRYALAVANEGDSVARYSLVFRQRLSLDERTGAVAWQDPVSSPRIETIRRRVTSGNRDTEPFWNEVAAQGTPLVEPFDATYDLVTFLWRARSDTRNVFLVGSMPTPQGFGDELHRLGSSDVWYLTLKVAKGARFSYQLEPNRPSGPDMARVTRQRDPFNRKMSCPSTAGLTPEVAAALAPYRCRSVGELPEAVERPWTVRRQEVAAGRIERHTVHSVVQNVDRELTIYTPAGYASAKVPCSLLVLFDGDDYLDSSWQGPEIWNGLIAAGRIPPTVVVMVHNLPGRRLFDLVGNAAFAEFMARELVPWVRAHYHVSRQASRTVVGGASAGGFAAAYVGLAHPEVFGNVLSMSGAFWWSPAHNGGICAGACADPDGTPAVSNRDATTEPNLVAQLALERPARRVRFYLGAGTFEFDRDGTAGGLLEETRHLRDILRAKGYPVVYEQFVGGHDGLSWPGVMANGLQQLLGASR
ncbi:MAG TPA: alpha/beta hydrolase-fold protein [Gemmatimonadaceae bacterium]